MRKYFALLVVAGLLATFTGCQTGHGNKADVKVDIALIKISGNTATPCSPAPHTAAKLENVMEQVKDPSARAEETAMSLLRFALRVVLKLFLLV